MDTKHNITIPEMLQKLDEMYQKKEDMENTFKTLYKQYQQILEDIDLTETIIMHTSNKVHRTKSENTNPFDFGK